MVKKVIGKANDFQFSMTRKEDTRWETHIPILQSGEYALELFAEDKAGNIAYMAQAVLIVDTARLCVKIVGMDQKILCNEEKLQEKIICTEYASEIKVPIHRKGGKSVNAKFILGEDKYVKIRVYDPAGDPFTIHEASYALTRYGNVIDSGNAFINGEDDHEISAKIKPPEKGSYVLEYTYQVADTVRKARIDIEVV